MKEFIETNQAPSSNANIPQQAIFYAQRHLNNTDRGHLVVMSAEYVEGGIMAECEDVNNVDGDRDLNADEQAAFDEAVSDTIGEGDGVVVEQIGPADGPVEGDKEPEPTSPENNPDKLKCSKCGKPYSTKGRGPEFHDKHEAKCKG